MALNSMEFYVTVCRVVLQSDASDPKNWMELHRCIRCLRQSLSCYVCTRLVSEPMAPVDSSCQHAVCQKCVGGKMRMKPACSWCKDRSTFKDKPLLKTLVTCFKKLCEYIQSSSLGQDLNSQQSLNNEAGCVVAILQEATGDGENGVEDSAYSTGFISNSTEFSESSARENSVDTTNIPSTSGLGNTKSSLCTSRSDDDDHQTADFKVPDCKMVSRSLSRMPFRRGKRSIASKSTKKAVIFMKRASQNKKRKLNEVAGSSGKSGKKKTKLSTQRKGNNSSLPDKGTINSESQAEDTMPVLKSMKEEPPPPELKPSFCRCGNSGNYNQLTCLGQKCPCYSMKLPCIGCKCKGCRNPKKGPVINRDADNCNSTTALLRSGTRNQSESLCVNM